MKILGIDLSLVGTAICILEKNKISGNMDLFSKMIPGDKAVTLNDRIKRLIKISSEICKIYVDHNIEYVIIEAPALNQKWQSSALGEMFGAVKIELFKAGANIQVEQATKMRKEVIGSISRSYETYTDTKGKKRKRISYGTMMGKNGKKKKASVKDIIQQKLESQGLKFATQDEMDAYVAAKYLWQIKIRE